MNVEHLKNIVSPLPYDVETRLFAIATNAVQEAREAKNRGRTPFSDNDLKVIQAIKAALLRIEQEGQVIQEKEHAPLVSQETKTDPVLDKVHTMLESELLEVVDRQRQVLDKPQEIKKPIIK
jgi:hypothetical protein